MEVVGQRHAAAALPPGQTPYPLCRLGGPQGGSGRVRKISSFHTRINMLLPVCCLHCGIFCFVDRASYYGLCKWPTWRTVLFHIFVYSNSLHVSSNQVLIIRKVDCIDTTSGICHWFKFAGLLLVCVWCHWFKFAGLLLVCVCRRTQATVLQI